MKKSRGNVPVKDILTRPHWVFDLDGTLTVAVHDFGAIRRELGIPEGVDILGHIDSLPEAEARRLHRRLDEIEDGLARKAEPSAGAVRLVELLHRRGKNLGIVTRNTRHIALRVLETIGVANRFAPEDVLGRHDAIPKPHPHGLQILSARWGTRGNSMVMVGDYLFDLQSGRASGAATIHVDRSRCFRWPEFTDIAVESLDELAEMVEDTR